MKKIINENFYDANEVAEMLSLCVATVRRYLADGKIKGTKIGKSWHVKEKDLKKYLSIDESQESGR